MNPKPKDTPMDRLVRALAQAAVNEYLTEEAALRNGLTAERPNPVPLPDLEQAA